MILRPEVGIMPSDITCMTAVAVCRAIEDITHHEPSIKCVNDVYVKGKKVCGILTEGAYSFEDERLEYAIVGIGINVTKPKGGFDESIEDIATYLEDDSTKRNVLIARILSYMYDYITSFDKTVILSAYRERMRFLGCEVDVIMHNGQYNAVVDRVDDDFGLIVRADDGAEKKLTYGEISLKVK